MLVTVYRSLGGGVSLKLAESLPAQIGGIIEALLGYAERKDSMQGQQINCLSSKVLILLSSIALLTVLTGYTQPPQTDEGAAAHIFQLAIVALVPVIFLFIATADWKRPMRSARSLAFPAVALVLAFGALYYLEHHR